MSGVNTLEVAVVNLPTDSTDPQANPAGVLYDMTIAGNTSVNCTATSTGGGGTTGGGDTVGGGNNGGGGGGGGGGSSSGSKKKRTGNVLGTSTDRPQGQVLGVATSTMPVGAPNTGTGGTSPLFVQLPTLLAILSSTTSVRKAK